MPFRVDTYILQEKQKNDLSLLRVLGKYNGRSSFCVTKGCTGFLLLEIETGIKKQGIKTGIINKGIAWQRVIIVKKL